MNPQELTKALGGRWNGSSGKACCPGHDDKTPSLSISEGDSGCVLVRCHAGCDQERVINALKARDLWPEAVRSAAVLSRHTTKAKPRPAPNGAQVSDWDALFKQEPVDFWDYRDQKGRLIGYTARLEGRGGKKILPVTYDGKGWVTAAFPEPRPLYQLPALASRADASVVVVEGEKTCCAAQTILEDQVVVTWPGGTNAVDKVDWTPLAGRRVTLWPDADEPGKKAANQAATILLRIGAATVHAVKLPDGLPEGWDLADAIPEGLDIENLIRNAVDIRAARLKSLDLVNAAALLDRVFTKPKFAVPGVLPEGCAILAARPKTGKSWMALDFATAIASGGIALASIRCEPGPVLYLALEDTERRLFGRFKTVLQGAKAPVGLDIATHWRPADQGGLDDLRAWLDVHSDARCIIIDTLAKIRGKPDPKTGVYAQDYATIASFKALADEFAVPMLLIHHLRKEKADDPLDTISGTAGLTGAVDTVLVLKRDQGSPHAVLYVRGRDIQETEIAMQFDDDTGRWIKLGPADDFRKSQERKAVVRALIDAGKAMTPAEMVDVLGKKRGTIKVLLHRMAKDGEITSLGNGTYAVRQD